VESKKLESWKEIAAYLGRSIRTVQRWEKENGLPVRRGPGEGVERVFAFADELDRWMHSDRTPDKGLPAPAESGPTVAPVETPPAAAPAPAATAEIDGRQAGTDIPAEPALGRKGFPWRIIAAVGILLLAAAVWRLSTGTRGTGHPPVAGLRFQGRTLIALDAAGRELWHRVFPEPLARWDLSATGYPMPPEGHLDAVTDLDGDGIREILVVTQSMVNPLRPGILHCLDERGAGLWQYQPGRPLVFGNTRYDEVYNIRFFLLEDFNHDGRKEILILAHNHSYFPSTLTLLDCAGRPHGQYVHSGHFQTATLADLDGNGRKEILAAGINNGYLRGFLAILDDRALAGTSPQPDTPNHRCAGAPPGQELYYLLFPRDCVNLATENYGRAQEIRVGPDAIGINTGYILRPPCPVGGGVIFRLDRQLRLLGVDADPAYLAYHRCLETAGILGHPFSPGELDRMEPILYWNGERYTPEPTRNLRAALPSHP
jgi:hypothetical protein